MKMKKNKYFSIEDYFLFILITMIGNITIIINKLKLVYSTYMIKLFHLKCKLYIIYKRTKKYA
jgi:hypothetical protein